MSRPSSSKASRTSQETSPSTAEVNSITLVDNSKSCPQNFDLDDPKPSLSLETDSCTIADSESSTTLEFQKLSTVRLLITHFGYSTMWHYVALKSLKYPDSAALALFLATTDATIVSTSLPTIASDLHATQDQYTWVGVSYMLTQTALQPLYGRISDLVGRKKVLYCSILVFALGSLLCGAAQTINWLIAARALAGIGGGGIVGAVWVLTAEIVEVQHRAKWSQALSVTWSCSAVAGPLLGGVFSSNDVSTKTNWRWGFYINLPICLVATSVLYFSLRGVESIQPSNASWRTLAKRFDFGGLILFMAGTSCIIVGFSFANEAGWKAVSTLLLIFIGLLSFVLGGVYEKYTTRECLFPGAMFTNITSVIVLLVTFLHQVTFTSGTFYLALFYQAATGSSPLQAGLKMLPYSLGSSIASMPAAWAIGWWQKRTNDTRGQKWIIAIGLLISTIGFGTLNLLNEHAPIYAQVIYPLIAGCGLGMLFHAPYQVLSRVLDPKDLASGTSAFFLVRFTGATIGLAVAGMIFFARAVPRWPSEFTENGSLSSIDYSGISHLQPIELRNQVLHVVSSSIQTVWTVWTPCLGLAFLLSFALRTMSIQGDTANNEVAGISTPQSTTEKSKIENESQV